MRKKLELSKYIACICEGGAEKAVMDILLENKLLIFSKENLIEGQFFKCRGAQSFQEQYLRKKFK